eukprot:392227-Alexandrium_andersonii.AAC.1
MKLRHCSPEHAARNAQIFNNTSEQVALSLCMFRLESSVQFYACSKRCFYIVVGSAELHIGT